MLYSRALIYLPYLFIGATLAGRLRSAVRKLIPPLERYSDTCLPSAYCRDVGDDYDSPLTISLYFTTMIYGYSTERHFHTFPVH